MPAGIGSSARLSGKRPQHDVDIDVLELPFDTALAMVGTGEIADAKTIMLLQWAALSGPFRS